MGKIKIALFRGSQRGRNILLGAENIILAIAKKIDKQLFDPLIIVLQAENDEPPPLVSEARTIGLRVEIVKLKGRFDSSAISKLRNLLLENKIHILHTNEYRSDIIGFMATRGTGIKTMATAHGWLNVDFKIKFYEWLDSLFLRFFNMVVSVSNAMKNELIKAGVPTGKLKVIENAIDYTDIQGGEGLNIRGKIGAGPDTVIVGSVGRLSLERGYSYFLSAAREISIKFPQTKFLLVGDGVLRESLTIQTQKLGIKEKISFLGFRKDMKDIYSAIDIFVSSSLRESFGLALIEAMAAGKPVVATALGIAPEIIKNGENGFLVTPGNPAEISEALSILLSNDDKRREMGASAKRTIESRFSQQKMVKEYEAIYRSLANR